ncbi:MAG: hypothetical protein II841_09615 [Bacteroidales bacterium]|nr:hypothetical protein [Bacteroidales bacterium]
MKGNYIKYLLLCFLQLALLSCIKETPENRADESANTILYSVTVSQSPLTRVALGGSDFADGGYVFESGDKLYVEYRDGETLKLYGVLTLVSGAGSGTGRFEGELKCLNEFVPEDNTLLTATVVGANAAEGFFNFENPTNDPAVDPGSIVTGVTYPSSVSYAPLPEMVQKYSYFTGTSTYDAKNFNNLTQQSVFLQFSLEVNRTKLGDPMMVTTVSVKKDDNPVYAVTDVPVTGLSAVGYIQCTGVVPVSKNPDFQSAEIWADNLKCGNPFASDLSLDVNHYYSVKRSSLLTDWFRIKATQDGTTVVTFNYCEAKDSIKYSLDGGENWTDYLTKTQIPLSAGQEVCFQGRREKYKNAKAEGGNTYGAPASTPIFEADKLCLIAGNIMTLLADRENLSDEAFDGAFSKDGKDNTWTDIDPSDPLLLPDTTLTLRCYKGMFRRCTKLQYAPDLPAETPAAECYSGMFRQCGNNNLKRVTIFLKAKTGEENNKGDFDYAKLGEGGYLDKWMADTNPASGALYCHPDMVAYWQNYWIWYNTLFANRPKNWSINAWTTYLQP